MEKEHWEHRESEKKINARTCENLDIKLNEHYIYIYIRSRIYLPREVKLL